MFRLATMHDAQQNIYTYVTVMVTVHLLCTDAVVQYCDQQPDRYIKQVVNRTLFIYKTH